MQKGRFFILTIYYQRERERGGREEERGRTGYTETVHSNKYKDINTKNNKEIYTGRIIKGVADS